MRITSVTGHHVRTGVRLIEDGGIAPYAGSQDKAGVSHAQSLLIRVSTDDGVDGWGEINTGFPLAVDRALVDEWIAPTIVGLEAGDIIRVIDALDAPYWPQLGRRALACAVEMALWDILGRSLGVPVSTLLGGRIRERVPVAFCMGLTDVPTAVTIATRAFAAGWTVLKTKIGIDLAGDLERVRAITEATGGGLKLRLDANQALDRVMALRMLPALEGYPIEYVEQPLPVGDFVGCRTLRDRTTVPIAINEDAYMPGGMARAIEHGAIDAAVVDIEGAMGVRGLVELGALGRQFGIPVAHHCGWDLGVKAAMMLQVAAATPGLSLASDSTYAMHLDDVLVTRLSTENGEMAVPLGPGIGVDVDLDAVERLRVV